MLAVTPALDKAINAYLALPLARRKRGDVARMATTHKIKHATLTAMIRRRLLRTPKHLTPAQVRKQYRTERQLSSINAQGRVTLQRVADSFARQRRTSKFACRSRIHNAVVVPEGLPPRVAYELKCKRTRLQYPSFSQDGKQRMKLSLIHI